MINSNIPEITPSLAFMTFGVSLVLISKEKKCLGCGKHKQRRLCLQAGKSAFYTTPISFERVTSLSLAKRANFIIKRQNKETLRRRECRRTGDLCEATISALIQTGSFLYQPSERKTVDINSVHCSRFGGHPFGVRSLSVDYHCQHTGQND